MFLPKLTCKRRDPWNWGTLLFAGPLVRNYHAYCFSNSEVMAAISVVHCSTVSSTSPTRRSVNGRDYAAEVNVPVILIFITILCLVHCFNIVARTTCAFMDAGVRAGPDSVVALGKTLHCPPSPNYDTLYTHTMLYLQMMILISLLLNTKILIYIN